MFFRRSPLLILFAAGLLFTACSSEISGPQGEQIAGKSALAMPDKYAAQVSEDILRAGGNAVDAAIAAGFALAVTYPEAGNIGGGGFMLIHMNGEDTFLNYRETAPLAAHRDMYLDEKGDVLEGASLHGIMAAGVPGTVAGFWSAYQRFGTLPWKDLLAPAIELAENGFLVSEELANRRIEYSATHAGKTNFDKYFGHMAAGEIFRQADLANTLRRIAENSVDDFYSGQTAELTVEFMKQNDGLITAEDLTRYMAVWRKPIKSDWRGYTVVSAPPPSSGGFAVTQLLKMKEYIDHHFQGLLHNSPQYIHLIAEIEKRVFADRAEYLGDPDYVDVPIEELLDDDYIAMRAEETNAEEISRVDGVPPGLESHNTIHYSLADRWGNAVSNTYTINDWFGSGVVVRGAGFLLNGEMDDFSVKPGVPNLYGVVGKTSNEIQPGKRMLSSLSPTILLKDGEVSIVLGALGGSTIFTSVFQTIINLVDFNMTAESAVAATKFHHQLLPPDLITYTPQTPFPRETISALGDRGYRAEPHFFLFGDVQLIVREGDDIQAASDPLYRGESRIVTH